MIGCFFKQRLVGMNKNVTLTESGDKPWRFLQRQEIDSFVRSLTTAYDVVGVLRRKGRLRLDRITDPTELLLEFPPQVHSAKKFLFPHWERLFRFRIDGKVLLESEKAAPPRVIFGMHSCDIQAVRILDDCLFEGQADSTYRAKREATLIVGVDCIPDDQCFCSSMGNDPAANGFDLFLHRVEGGYLLQSGTRRGWSLVEHHAPEVILKEAQEPLCPSVKNCTKKLFFPADSLVSVLDDCYNHPIWERIGKSCLGCGACSLVCPTCYCFNVQDSLDLNLESGSRVRTWDSCQLDQFTQVAGGNDFRGNQADRQRHRFYRKYKYLWEQYQRTACVGCGRCVRECLSRIDPVDILNELHHEQVFPQESNAPGEEYHPHLVEIVSIETLTTQDKLFRLRLPQVLDYEPGMFLEVSIFGIGEAPFSIVSSAENSLYVEVVVRAAGNLTRALHRLKVGDVVGVRGPFGRGFPLRDFEHQDVLLVAGGMGMITLRPLLLAILAKRENFGRVQLLYGARTANAFLFFDDLVRWHASGELDCRYIVQHGQGDWTGPEGDITQLLKELDIVPERTVAAVSGPSGMYRFTNPLLFRLGLSEKKVFLNLERHMKCGLGKCGRCQINDIRVCECGPIFPYSQIRHLHEAIER